jgi:hypothetical protein
MSWSIWGAQFQTQDPQAEVIQIKDEEMLSSDAARLRW